ncbi:carbon catabolite repressor protein 4 homolog 6 [Aristolochia californica]|uniref:carbon catabolite repressor protein 4 homolog 6 n=1 Tax=Aristolochia californica TaxID=171875 RepID=UPI0035E1853F
MTTNVPSALKYRSCFCQVRLDFLGAQTALQARETAGNSYHATVRSSSSFSEVSIMRVVSPYVHSLVSAASDASTMSSRFSVQPPHATYRGRNSWRRGFSDRFGDGEEVFVSGDSYSRIVRDASYASNSNFRGYSSQPFGSRGQQRPLFRPPPRPDDFRSWVFTPSQPPPHWERFVVLSYNILADYLARDHRPRLYFHIPSYILDWEWRKRRIMIELGLWAPDIMCFQEVDRFQDLEIELNPQGYSGIWKMRTGAPLDGCAIFWRTSRFSLLHEEAMEFKNYGLRDNIAQICVLESSSRISPGNGSMVQPMSSHSGGSNKVVICNIHVLYNPNRGDIKLGQVRVLLDRAHAISRTWNDAPVVICGDFNSTPKSPLYNFILEQKLSLSGLSKNEVSGQSSACIYAPRTSMSYPGVQSASNNPNGSHVTVIDKTNNINQNSFPTQLGGQRKSQCDGEEASLQKSSWSSQLMSEGLFDSISEGTFADGIEFLTEHTDKVSGEFVEEKTDDQTLSTIAQEGQLKNASSSVDSASDQFSALVGKVDEIVIEELHLSGDRTAYSLENETPVCSTKDAPTCEVNCDNDKHVLEEAKQSAAFVKLEIELEADDTETYSLGVDPCPGLPNVLCNTNVTDGSGYGENSSENETISQLNKHIVGEKGQVNLQRSDGLSLGAEDDSMLPVDMGAIDVEKKTYDPYLWTPEELAAASGNAECNHVEHSLKLKSVYTEVEDYAGTRDAGGEPQITSYHRRFMGTVDYIWFSEGLQTVKVLDTIPKHVLQRTPGFPTRKWGSDHLALACQLAFKDLPTKSS